MTQTLDELMEDPEPGPKESLRRPRARKAGSGRRRGRRPGFAGRNGNGSGLGGWRLVVMMVVAAVGLGLVLYPQAADWFSSISHNNQLSGYAQDVDRLEPSARTKILDRAREYNSRIPAGQLRDPYSAQSGTAQTPATTPAGQLADYQSQLNVANDEVIGRFRYPSLNIDLPVFHGTGEEVLAKGVGHLYGSSLPVGGSGTHAVLTSHSGIPNAELFNPLHHAKTGDIFSTEVLDRTFLYRVTGIEVVKPDDISSLKITPGQDTITLITCTPIGVNSHRLLVHATRIPDLPKDAPEQKTLATPQTDIGFPYWALYYTGGLTAFYLTAVWNHRRNKQPRRSMR